MQIRRRFQPVVVGLPYRIAPSSMVEAPPVIAPPPGTGTLVMASADADMAETGKSTPIIVAPPTGGNVGIC